MTTSRRLPQWLKAKMPGSKNYIEVKNLINKNSLNTVCADAKCPNIGECWDNRTATFMILGDICTRACRYCAVKSGKPIGLDIKEPLRVSDAVKKLDLKYAVLTSVDRDDLPDGGSFIFKQCINLIHKNSPGCKVEVLIPDFQGDWNDLKTVMDANPETLNHNIETVERVFKSVRAKGDYRLSLDLLLKAKELNSYSVTKSGLMVGLGETWDEIINTLKDLRAADCDLLTIGQYIKPTPKHVDVIKWYTPEEFIELRSIAKDLGFKGAVSGPLVRSSYKADEQYYQAKGLIPIS
ncbi:MAG: lipoyl synthase [Chloroflexi bacterium]|nr:lipoyl synthase [Chloroflexota bacterium]